MKAVIPDVHPSLSVWRKRTGADKWDEMWEGVLHMAPMPNRDHQELEWAMETWLRTFWAPPRNARVYHNINVAAPGAWPDDYRIPDLVLLLPERFHIDRNEYFDGGPNVVVEIRSGNDESYEKLEFYARIQVEEVWIVDRDTKAPEIHVLRGSRYVRQDADADGWVRSAVTGLELRADGAGKLAMRLVGEAATVRDLP